MSKIGQEMLEAAREMLAFAEGKREGFVIHRPEEIDVKAIRTAQGLTQAAFAGRYGFTLAAMRDWEQGRRRPERPARILLRVIQREPEAVRRALAAE